MTGSGWSGPPAKMRWRSRRPTGGRSLTPEAGNLRSAREAASVLVSYEGEGRRERLTQLSRSLLASGAPDSHPRLRVLHHGHRQRPRTVPERWPARRREDPRLRGRRGSPCCGAAHPNGGGGEHRHQDPALLQRALRQRVSSAPNVVNTMPDKPYGPSPTTETQSPPWMPTLRRPRRFSLLRGGPASISTASTAELEHEGRTVLLPLLPPACSNASRASCLRSLQPRAMRLRRPAGGPAH